MRLPSDFLDRVRDHFRVSEVVGKYIPVKRAGREFHACCPFHNEKTPSFTINDTKNFYHCFGCGAHGDAISFVKDYEKLSYMEAVEKLAAMAGIPMPVLDARAQEHYDARKKIYEALELATQFFVVQLNSAEAMNARSYLQDRGLTSETLQRFRIGYAPADKNALRQFLLQKGIRLPEAVAAGLLIEGYGEPYSRFQARIMFPIVDTQKRVVAFGGRVLPDAPATGAASAKYINSPETELFKKGQMLFNAANARKAVTQEDQQLVVVEGYMDVIALAQAGHDASVAALGTSMTETHLQLLWRMTPEPVVCLDGDAAGIRAMHRALELALPAMAPDAGLKFAMLPDKHDPDSLVKAQGLAAFQKILGAATPMSQMIWQQWLEAHGSATAEARARLEQAVMAQCDKVKNQTSQRHLRDFLRQQLRELNYSTRPAKGQWQPKNGKKPGVSPQIPTVASSQMAAAQETLLAFLLVAPELLHSAEVEDFVGHMIVEDESLRAVQQGVMDSYHLHHDAPNDVLVDALKAEVWPHLPARVQSLLRHAMPLQVQNAQDHDARRLALLAHWQKLHEAYYTACLEEEMRHLVKDLAGEQGEAAMARMSEVQAEIARLKERRFALTEEGF